MRQLIGYLRLVHGAFNASVMVFFIYQGWVGLRIRRERLAGTMTPPVVRKHRKDGPVLALLAVIGYFSGLILVVAHFGKIVKYPYHLACGTALILTVAVIFSISGRIKVRSPEWRTVHVLMGLFVIGLYAVQLFLGLGMLF